MNKESIRKIQKKDIKKVLYIYNYHIENSLSNFAEKKITLRNFSTLVNKIIRKKLPFIIYEKNNNILGLAFLDEYRYKSGYRYTFENSIYVHPDFMNIGIGSKLLKNLILYSKKNNNIKNIVAVIGGSKNHSSIKIHKKNGFIKIGILKKVGFKKNKWIDSVYMQKIL